MDAVKEVYLNELNNLKEMNAAEPKAWVRDEINYIELQLEQL